jgi:hypothetical protein
VKKLAKLSTDLRRYTRKLRFSNGKENTFLRILKMTRAAKKQHDKDVDVERAYTNTIVPRVMAASAKQRKGSFRQTVELQKGSPKLLYCIRQRFSVLQFATYNADEDELSVISSP